MNRLICNDQGPVKKNADVSGIFPYASGDYGANWVTTSSITAALSTLFSIVQNGDAAMLYNTNATGGGIRLYGYANGTWAQI